MSPDRVIYLDQADWSYLHAGASPQAERRLRQVGEDPSVAFLVSLHHFEEINGLQSRDERAGYLRAFPGTALVTATGFDLVAIDAQRLAGQEPPQSAMEIKLQRLADVSDSDLESLKSGFQNARRLRALTVPLHDRRRELHQLDLDAVKRRGGRKNSADDLALWRALIRGDVKRAIEIWERVMRATATVEERELIAADAFTRSRNWKQGEAAGVCPPSELDFDETFVLGPFQYLPVSIRGDRVRLASILKRWESLARSGSPLSCYSAVVHGVLVNPSRAYEQSSAVDALHAAFAPLADIFTCDKRTCDDLRRVDLRARVLRTGRLDDVVAALAA